MPDAGCASTSSPVTTRAVGLSGCANASRGDMVPFKTVWRRAAETGIKSFEPPAMLIDRKRTPVGLDVTVTSVPSRLWVTVNSDVIGRDGVPPNAIRQRR